ncbi:MAG: S8 family serine peptidase [Chitinophagaceae bacterium]
MIEVKVTLPLYIRKGPGRSFAPIGTIQPSGKIIQMDGIKEDGENWKGIAKWYYKLNDKNQKQWYWAGRLEPVTAEKVALPWSMTNLRITDVWRDFNESGRNAKIAIMDSGYNINNTEIANAIAGKRSFIIADPEQTTDNDMNDEFGHGSHCAALIAARNITNMVGFAPACKLYVGKVSQLGELSFDTLIKGIRWAIDTGVDIISISYGGPDRNKDLEDIIQEAINIKNIIVVASIGDDFTFQNLKNGDYPALFSDCIAVGATNKDSKMARVSYINTKTEIYAPGEDIPSYALGNTPENMTGTSQAAAIVAGICALMVSRHRAIGKSFTPASIKKLITDNFDPITGSNNLKLISPKKIFNSIK